MRTERIGTKAASANQRILFFRSNMLVDANFDRVTEMSAAELRELAGVVAGSEGHADNLPTLPEYLPKNRMRWRIPRNTFSVRRRCWRASRRSPPS